jgi:hypothetical protein
MTTDVVRSDPPLLRDSRSWGLGVRLTSTPNDVALGG